MNTNSIKVSAHGMSAGTSYLVSQSRSKSGGILNVLKIKGVAEAEKVAEVLGLNLFAVDVGQGSRVEIWNKAWNRKLVTTRHLSNFAA